MRRKVVEALRPFERITATDITPADWAAHFSDFLRRAYLAPRPGQKLTPQIEEGLRSYCGVFCLLVGVPVAQMVETWECYLLALTPIAESKGSGRKVRVQE